MSAPLTNIQTQQYRTQMVGFPVTLCSPTPPPGAFTVSALIDWSDYFAFAVGRVPEARVQCNLQRGIKGSPIDAVRSVKIDNTFSDVPIYVSFIDTSDTIVAGPGQIVTMPIMSKDMNPLVTATPFKTQLPVTQVFFNNFPLPPSVNYELFTNYPQFLASNLYDVRPGVGSSLARFFGSPALNDVPITGTISLAATATHIIFPRRTGGADDPSMVIIGSIYLRVGDLTTSIPGAQTVTCFLASAQVGVPSTVFAISKYGYVAPVAGVQNAGQTNGFEIFNQSGLNWRYPWTGGDLSISISQAITGGTLSYTIGATLAVFPTRY